MEIERRTWVNNGVISIGFPQDIVKWLGLTDNCTIVFKDETGKNGKYISIWVKGK